MIILQMTNKLENFNTETDLPRPLVYANWFLRSFPRVVASQRALAYASEVGESFRPIIPKYFVNAAYATSFLYVGADTMIHRHNMIEQKKSQKEVRIQTMDRLIWHSLASMLLPALTIHSIVKYSGLGINKFNMFTTMPKIRTWTPTLLALGAVPFIIHPIDHLTDHAMDNSIRKLYNNQ